MTRSLRILINTILRSLRFFDYNESVLSSLLLKCLTEFWACVQVQEIPQRCFTRTSLRVELVPAKRTQTHFDELNYLTVRVRRNVWIRFVILRQSWYVRFNKTFRPKPFKLRCPQFDRMALFIAAMLSEIQLKEQFYQISFLWFYFYKYVMECPCYVKVYLQVRHL